MKILNIFIIFLGYLFSIHLVEPNDEGKISIFIYHSGKALIHENRNIEFFEEGKKRLKIIGIPDQILDNGIQIDGDNFSQIDYKVIRDFITEDMLLEYFVGSKILLKDFENNKTIDATLISYNNNKSVYGIEEGVIVNPKLKPVFPHIPQHLENKIVIESNGNSKPGKNNLKLSYFTMGMKWDAEYHLKIIEKDKVILSGEYKLINNTNKSFFQTELFLVASNNNNISYKKNRRNLNEMSMKSIDNSQSTPQQLDIEDVEIYQVPQKVTLNKNSNLSASFLAPTSLSLEKLYIATHSANFYGSRRRENEGLLNSTEIYIRLNSSENILNHLPQGIINIYEMKDELEIFLGEKYINKISKGNDIKFQFKLTQDILHRFTTEDLRETIDGYFLTIKAEFKNLKDHNVEILWYENSRFPLEVKNSNINFNIENKFSIYAKLQLKPEETRTESITLFTEKRK